MNIGDKLFGIKGIFNPADTATGLQGVGGIISLFLNTAFVLSGLILLFFFIMGGIGMISSAGQSDPQKAEQAKKTITSAIIGFVIVFTSYWIVKLISSLLGISNLIF
ncbi:MAG: hypothetical protein NT162_02210 [Candidatus Woesebacteria bacterium]|nr:hypothetical protein [Candidatus Woesebacteria bacterium]